MSAYVAAQQVRAGLGTVHKLRKPVSQTLDGNGQAVVVSYFGDDVWDLWPYITHENRAAGQKVINWRIALNDGSRLTEPQHQALLESCKDFILSLRLEPIEGRARPSMTSLVHRVNDMIPLLRWMTDQGIASFENLRGRTLDYVPFARQRTRRTERLSSATIALRLAIPEAIYLQRSKLADALQVHPWPDESAGALSGAKYGLLRSGPKTGLIPENIVTQLARAALDDVLNRAVRQLADRCAVEAASQAMSLQREHPVHASIARTRTARHLGYSGYEHLLGDLTRLRTACCIVIGLFSGIRNSEMMSLGEDCLRTGKSRDQSVDLIWIQGTLYKTGKRQMRWLVPQVVGKAIEVLRELTQPLRERLCQEFLASELAREIGEPLSAAQSKRHALVRGQLDKLFLSGGSGGESAVHVLTNGTVNAQLKEYCGHHGIVGDGETAYCLHSHQFRRTYAHFVARSELGDLFMLRDHFGHASIDMSLLYADGGADNYEADHEMLEWIAQEKNARQAQIVSTVIESNEPLGNPIDWLDGWRRQVRTAPNKEELVREFSDSINLTGTGHSWCVGSVRGAGCGGLCVLEADLCVDCKYGIITQEHRPVWQGIRDQQSEALAMDDLGASGQARARKILLKAQTVLQRLDGGESK